MTVVFLGTGAIGIPALKAMAEHRQHDVVAVVTQPDRPAGRSQVLTPSPIKAAAIDLHLKVFQPENINQPTAIEQIRYFRPDAVVVAAYGQILLQPVLELPQMACLNIHASLLPKHRGASPIQAAIRQGDVETGITIIWMNEGIDTGDVLLQESTRLRSKDTAETVHDRLALIGAQAIVRALDSVEQGRAPRLPQEHSLATYARKLRKEDGHLDWSNSCDELDRHIRAMSPWPSAYTWAPDGRDHRMLKVFSAIISHRAEGQPGEIVNVDSHGILVASGKGGLLLREVQLEGKRRMTATEFARGFNLPVGAILE
jgi:methionyl-tRNA formyltransferase